MSTRFHPKWHRSNHHTNPTIGAVDSAHDPIASQDQPFQGGFYLNGPLSASQNLTIDGTSLFRNSITALAPIEIQNNFVNKTGLSVFQISDNPAFTVYKSLTGEPILIVDARNSSPRRVGINLTTPTSTLDVSGTMRVTSHGLFGGNLSISGDVSARNDVFVGNSLTAQNDIYIGDDLTVGDNAVINNSLTAQNDIYIGDDLTVGDNAVINNSLTAQNDVYIGDDLIVTKSLSALSSDVYIKRNLAATSGITAFNQPFVPAIGTITMPGTIFGIESNTPFSIQRTSVNNAWIFIASPDAIITFKENNVANSDLFFLGANSHADPNMRSKVWFKNSLYGGNEFWSSTEAININNRILVGNWSVNGALSTNNNVTLANSAANSILIRGSTTFNVSSGNSVNLEMGSEGVANTHVRFNRNGTQWALMGQGGSNDFILGSVSANVPVNILQGNNNAISIGTTNLSIKNSSNIVLDSQTINVSGTNVILGSSSSSSLTANGSIIAPNATDTSANRLANVGALRSIFSICPAAIVNGTAYYAEDVNSGNARVFVSARILNNTTMYLCNKVANLGRLHRAFFQLFTSQAERFLGWSNWSSGNIIVASNNIFVTTQYSLGLSSSITVTPGDVITGNVTGATGTVFFASPPWSGTRTTDDIVLLNVNGMFSSADTNILLNGAPTGVGITNTRFGPNPGPGIYVWIDPMTLNNVPPLNQDAIYRWRIRNHNTGALRELWGELFIFGTAITI